MLNLGLEFTKLKRRSFLLSLIVIIIVELVWISVVINHELANTHEAYNAIFDMAYINDLILPLFISVWHLDYWKWNTWVRLLNCCKPAMKALGNFLRLN